ncbi:SseB family protein [Galactobacter caseinivorans]|uniref:SseB family protein n=1 Tax=Galactobacter caseinivorans TaxID=2676123 RepID=A0A496PJ55_9MICC|nr:SseB family protein [Galactobacter caseinivorans]RKW70534.1 hypothetical protein DWQ67_08690 [Galactobacter caseinivorans]
MNEQSLGNADFNAEEFDSAEAAKQAGEGGRLMQSFVRQDQDPSLKNDLAVVSDFYGTVLQVPVLALPVDGEPLRFATFQADGDTILGASLRPEEAVNLHRTIAESEGRSDDALGEPLLVSMLGSELVDAAFATSAFASTGIDTVVVDPLGLGIAFGREDQLLDYKIKSGALRQAVHRGKEAVLAYLMGEGATGVMMFNPDAPGDPAALLLRDPQTGAQVFPLFSSAMEVFRFSEKFATAGLTGPWLRQAMLPDMHLVVDPSGGDAIEFAPAELAAAGFRLPRSS